MLKKIFLLLICTNFAVVLSAEEPQRLLVKSFTKSQISALMVIRKVEAVACGLGMASSAVSVLPGGTPCAIKAALFVPVAVIFTAVGYQAWEEYDMDGFYKRHKWLLFGL